MKAEHFCRRPLPQLHPLHLIPIICRTPRSMLPHPFSTSEEVWDSNEWAKRAKRAFQGERSEPWEPLQPIVLIHSVPTTLKNRKSVHKHQRNESAQVAWISFFQSVKRKTFFARFARFARKFCFAQTFSGCFLMVWKKKFGRIEWKMSEQLQILVFDKRNPEEEQARFEDDDGWRCCGRINFPGCRRQNLKSSFVRRFLNFFFPWLSEKNFLTFGTIRIWLIDLIN